jgi:hypothetical protein
MQSLTKIPKRHFWTEAVIGGSLVSGGVTSLVRAQTVTYWNGQHEFRWLGRVMIGLGVGTLFYGARKQDAREWKKE